MGGPPLPIAIRSVPSVACARISTRIAAFRYRDKVHRVTINARTGAGAGERPWSVYKIAALAIFVGLVAFAIWWFTRG